ncbi:hypothetical protein MCP1_30061 [Candidatus Terasakiella magnetica]|nr:hypothetical protein MCP1_30061 [Candidatus Terasakiella magnetica]
MAVGCRKAEHGDHGSRWSTLSALLLAAMLAGSFAPAAKAGCWELLSVEVEDQEKASPLVLSDCDVTAHFEGSGRTARVMMQLKASVAETWRSALAPNGALAAALLSGKLAVRPNAGSLPTAPLLSSHSARAAATHAWIWVASSASLRIDPVDPAAGADGVQCPTGEARGGPILWMEKLEVSPGTLIAPTPYWATRPGNYNRIAPACFTGWHLSRGAKAVVHPALGLTIVAPDAPDGAIFEISAQMAGQSEVMTVSGEVRVTDPTRHPLAGNWTEIEEKPCNSSVWQAPAQPIGELIFRADGTFTLTRVPFESYVDYRGTYRHTVPSGALMMEISGGNAVPSVHLAKGSAHVMPSGELLLEELPPSSSAKSGQAVCSHRFRRQ